MSFFFFFLLFFLMHFKDDIGVAFLGLICPWGFIGKDYLCLHLQLFIRTFLGLSTVTVAHAGVGWVLYIARKALPLLADFFPSLFSLFFALGWASGVVIWLVSLLYRDWRFLLIEI